MDNKEFYVGFTGSRTSPNQRQRAKFLEIFREIVTEHSRIVFIHGDCVGSDEVAYSLVKENFPTIITTAYPGHDGRGNSPYRAYTRSDLIADSLPYMERNERIVRKADILLATPAEAEEQLRSGTWSTIRKARKFAVPTRIIVP